MTAPNTTIRFSNGTELAAFDPRRQPAGTRNLESPWFEAPGYLPRRIVMHKVADDEWATSLEVEHEGGHRSTCWGHYGFSYADAITDYLRRVQVLKGAATERRRST